ncbi:MAG TPA: NACHT domain-containing protein [Pyrinomonadaceae bacterium]|jgi:predicted NACHT family NTPase
MPDALKTILFLIAQLPFIGGIIFLGLQQQQVSWRKILLLVFYEIGIMVIAFGRQVYRSVFEERWVKYFGNRAEAVFSHPAFRRRYRDYILSDYVLFNFKGLTALPNPLRFVQIFVELRIERKMSLGGGYGSLIQEESKALAGNQPVWAFLKEHKAEAMNGIALAIIGQPGSGKTTLLQNIALTLAAGLHHNYQIPDYLPVTLFLREHGETIAENLPPLHQLLQTHFSDEQKFSTLKPPSDFFEAQLKEGACLVLLDGLDEVAKVEQRKTIRDWIDRQIKTYPASRFILTSRPQGYEVAPLQRVTVLKAIPFNDEQVNKFLMNWFLAHESIEPGGLNEDARQRAKETALNLIERLRETPALKDLTVNPLLLTMIAIVHQYHGALPGTRNRLYQELCDVLLERRHEAKQITPKFTAQQSLTALRPLATYMMENAKREINEDELLGIIAQPLAAHGVPVEEIKTFPDELALSSGLLLERDIGKWGFAHLSFQEYLTATCWAIQPEFNRDWKALVGDSWWYETLQFYAAEADATPIAAACREVQNNQALTLLHELVSGGDKSMAAPADN